MTKISPKNINPKKIDDLKGADYNPRYITSKQLAALKKSMENFGDLSGVVFNRATGVLVSGHQRIKTIAGKATKIVKSSTPKDRQGTVALGTIDVKEADGTLTKIPYREVDWDDQLQEMAANVAANAAGGEFDQAKLGAVMAKLEKASFDIELTSIDNWTNAKAIGKFKKSKDEEHAAANSDKSESFAIVDPSTMIFQHTCPKCSYRWSDQAAKVVKSSKPKVSGVLLPDAPKTKPKANK